MAFLKRTSVAVAKSKEFIPGPHPLEAFCDKPLATSNAVKPEGTGNSHLFHGNFVRETRPDYAPPICIQKYSSNSSYTGSEIPLYSSGLIPSCLKSALIASLHCLVTMFFTNLIFFGISGNSYSHVSRRTHEHDIYTIVWKIFHIHMTKHLIFLYQQGRRGIHCVFKCEKLFQSHGRRNFPQRSIANGGTIRTDFDFLHGGLALSGVSRFLLLVFTGVDVVVVAFLTKRYNWPKFRILRPHWLQTRSENLELSCTKENPT